MALHTQSVLGYFLMLTILTPLLLTHSTIPSLTEGERTQMLLGLSVWVTRTMSSLLFGVSPTDPVTFAAVALAASYLPARRAARVEPIVVLRAE